MNKTIYQCYQNQILVYYATSDADAMEWLEKNGGGHYKNVLHGFTIKVKG